jgi:hypothetical protein
MLVEALVKALVLKGITSNRALVNAVDAQFHPMTGEEQEIFSEAIVYAKQAILN